MSCIHNMDMIYKRIDNLYICIVHSTTTTIIKLILGVLNNVLNVHDEECVNLFYQVYSQLLL